jgi:putative membrane protein
MLKHTLLSCSMALTLILGAKIARAEDVSSQDIQFVHDAASAGMLEVQLGRYAMQTSRNNDIKKFGQEMVDDHSKANDELKGIAADKAIDIPHELNDEDKGVFDRLETLHEADFDKAYAAQMVKDHEKAIAAFKKESSDGSDSALKNFADKTLPILQHHLEMAQDLNKMINS